MNINVIRYSRGQEIKGIGFPNKKLLVKNWAKSVKSTFLIWHNNKKNIFYKNVEYGGIFIMPKKRITEELRQEIINYYLSQPMTMKQVEDKYNLSHPTISKILKNTPKYTRTKINSPSMKENFFQEIISEESAYFLGLLISDGNVFKDNTNRQALISITLKLQDEYMLEKFKTVLRANTSIGYDGRGCG